MENSKNTGRWTKNEEKLFAAAYKDSFSWKEVAKIVGTRTAEQCKSHYQKKKIMSKK